LSWGQRTPDVAPPGQVPRPIKVVGRPVTPNAGVVYRWEPNRPTITPTIIKPLKVYFARQVDPGGRVIKFGLTRRNPPPATSTNHGLIRISNFQIFLNVKRENDGGEIEAISTDASGTAVTFNKAFKDIETITATVKAVSGGAFIAVVDFNDVPNPTGFSVYVYDTAGVRQSKKVEWKARGIL
jgi:hypothetical protein